MRPGLPLRRNGEIAGPAPLDARAPISYIFAQETNAEATMDQPTEPLEGAPLIAPSTVDHPLYEPIVEACRTIYDPEIPVNIYELGLSTRSTSRLKTRWISP